MYALDTAVKDQTDRAAVRINEGVDERQKKIALLRQKGGIARADEPSRIASRIDRLSRFHPDIRPVDPAAIIAEDPKAMGDAGAILERIINTNELLGVRYLEGGVVASRSIGRVNIRDETGRLAGYGTGSLVSPELLLTNHHVLPDADVAAASAIEFNYQDGIDGQPVLAKLFGLAPKRFFLTDEELDFSVVAVEGNAQSLAAFGFNRLIESEGKAIVGDFVTIVQHPEGGKKQVALRDNRIVDVVETFLHYETDTQPGSSGSPVFNDQWEVVALHHASVPAPTHGELGGIVNEGIRVSRLVKFIRAQNFPSQQQAIVDRLFSIETTAVGVSPAELSGQYPATQIATPVEIPIVATNGNGTHRTRITSEAVTIDPDYSDRQGYDPDFLGGGDTVVPLPTLSEDMVARAAINSQASGEPPYLLPYHHFSIALNKERRLAFFTAVNIDGATGFRLRREPDKWSFDPRVPEDEQAGEELYRNNPLDRGHLVRRLDPAWGSSAAAAKICNDDTFHFTNCSPQHHDFNEYKTLWAGLEDYVLTNADNLKFRVCVFSGPVLAADDDAYRDIKLPRQFWKVVAMVKSNGTLSATAYLLSQADLIAGLEIKPEEFSYGAYRTYQVPLRKIQELTGLTFAELVTCDPLENEEALLSHKELEDFDHIQL